MSKTVWVIKEPFLYKNFSKYFTYDSNEQLADCLLEELNDLEEVNDSLESDIYELERENSRLEERLSEVEDELEVLNGLTHDT